MKNLGKVLTLGALLLLAGCNDDDDDDGGAGGTYTGGRRATGGQSTTGGRSSSGGQSASGGRSATGGQDGVAGSASGGEAGGMPGGGAGTGGFANGGAGGGTAMGGTAGENNMGGSAGSISGGAAGEVGTGGIGGSTLGGAGGEIGMAGGPGEGGAGGAVIAELRDVSVAMTGMTPHVGQLMEFRIVDSSNRLLFRGLLENLAEPDYEYVMPNSTPLGMHRVDFFSDLNDNGEYDAPPTDHAWTRPVAAAADVTIDFPHNTALDDIDDPAITPLGEDFTFEASGMTPHADQLFELRVIRMPDVRLVGRYVLTEVPGAAFSLSIPGIIEDGVDYRVDFFADVNGDGNYDAPPEDHAWREVATGSSTGLTVEFTHNTTFTDVAF